MKMLKKPKIKLHDDYKHILKKSWAIKWNVIAGVFAGAEVIIPLFSDVIPRNTFALLSFAAVAGSVWARLLVQPKDGL